ncbi:MAG: hypothetical protein M5U26_12960 [Planctomycetota bacterium]|nr:hypothetical protein [Planctomycetota bacterium]
MSVRTFGAACLIAVVTITGLTIAGELAEAVKATLTGLTGHHWVSKGGLAIVAFVASGLWLSRGEGRFAAPEGQETYGVAVTTIVCSLILTVLFIARYLSH